MPSPWTALAARPDLLLARHQIAETGRYYDSSRTIVLRSGMLLEDERRYLWHEISHADRRDQAGHTDAKVERLVDRHAAENAMPWCSILWAWEAATDLDEMAGLLRLPEDWVWRRVRSLHPAQKALLRVKVTSEVC